MVAVVRREVPLDSPEQLARRLALVRPADEGLGGALHAALDHVERVGGPAALAEVQRQLPPGEKVVDSFRYPPSLLLRIADAWAKWSMSQRGGDYAGELTALGEAWGARVAASPVGKTMLQSTGGDPSRLLASVAGAIRATNNYTEVHYERAGRLGHLQLRRNLNGAAWMLGMMREASSGLSGQSLPIEVTIADPLTAADFELTFTID